MLRKTGRGIICLCMGWGIFMQTTALWGSEPVKGIVSQFKEVQSFNEGLAPAKEGEAWGFINQKGEWIIKPQFKWASNFKEGVAIVAKEVEGEKIVGIIDKKGTIVVEKEFKEDVVASEVSSIHFYLYDDTKPDKIGIEIFDFKELPKDKTYVIIEATHKEGYRFKKLTVDRADVTDSFILGAYGGMALNLNKNSEVTLEVERVPEKLEQISELEIYILPNKEVIGDTMEIGERYMAEVFAGNKKVIGSIISWEYSDDKEMKNPKEDRYWHGSSQYKMPKELKGKYVRVKVEPMKNYSTGTPIYSKVYQVE
nr:WG repeat-containing protein [uncultured Niameybacter sp.]